MCDITVKFCWASPNRVEVVCPYLQQWYHFAPCSSEFGEEGAGIHLTLPQRGSWRVPGIPGSAFDYAWAGLDRWLLKYFCIHLGVMCHLRGPQDELILFLPLLLCWDESVLFLFSVVTNLSFSPLAVIYLRASHLSLAHFLPSFPPLQPPFRDSPLVLKTWKTLSL